MTDMVVVNICSKSKDVTVGGQYYAKVDSDGCFRVRDDAGRWSKYSPKNFNIVEDKDNQMSLYGVPADRRTEAKLDGKTTTAVGVDLASHDDYMPVPTITFPDGHRELDKSKLDSLTRAYVGGSPKGYAKVDPDTTELIRALTETPVMSKETLDELLKKAYTLDTKTTPVAPPAIKKTEIEKEHTVMKKTMTLRDILVGQGVPNKLIDMMNEFRKEHTDPNMPDAIKSRIPKPRELYVGGELWTQCITAILAGKHILLSGGKATGKNTLATSLAFAFQRPIWDVSFHSNISKDEIIGSETFRGGEVVFNPGMAYTCSLYGGFGVLDEINMAKDSAIAVLNSILDDRRVIDVPGYERMNLHPATVFIGTMNYGYAGTRPLNEALASRFVIPPVPDMSEADTTKLLAKKFPEAKVDILKYFSGVFSDLQKKARNAEISTASVDLRGIINALSMIEYGMNPNKAMESNIVNKAFEEYERRIVKDVVNTRVPTSWSASSVFPVSASSSEITVDMSGVK